MNNKLLTIIKKNNEEFDKKFIFDEVWSNNQLEGQRVSVSKSIKQDIAGIKNYLIQSRISEIDALIDILKKKEKTWGGYNGEEIVDDKQSLKYNEALDDIIKILKETKEELEKLKK